MNNSLNNSRRFLGFESAEIKALWRDLYRQLTRKSNRLLAFDQIRNGQAIAGQGYRLSA